MDISKLYELTEKEYCNCNKQGNLPTINHRADCKFLKVMRYPLIHYYNFKTIQYYGSETHVELGVLKAEVAEVKGEMAEVKSELVEIKAMLGDFLALFRGSTGTAGGSSTL